MALCVLNLVPAHKVRGKRFSCHISWVMTDADILLCLFTGRVRSAEIRCTSGAVNDSTTPRMGPVLVFIDNAISSMSGVEFGYYPVYSSVSPPMIIPA